MVDTLGGAVKQSKPEVIGYPVVGQPEKLAENVIGYDIREEQSISEYSVLNGASSTSNGEATIVYGVNAPKIIAKTSVVMDKFVMYGASFSLTSPSYYIPSGATEIQWLHKFNITEAKGDLEFTFNDEGLVFPTGGTFKMNVTYDTWGSSRPYNTRYVMNERTNPVTITEKTNTTNDYIYDELYFTAEAGDVLSVRCQVTNNGGSITGDFRGWFTLLRIS